jgi:hypothetical protein
MKTHWRPTLQPGTLPARASSPSVHLFTRKNVAASIIPIVSASISFAGAMVAPLT